ncbi:MAG: YjbE family putative metal transport protein [Oceanospirillaceae bacterium]|jgi:YjbE family integral membrane protein|nr:YjbE family putative metal transport protein [Oceanospirillaceae bacterium]MBT4443517.1 YjbE family putative metal transport protein [Oceanospirillaceae bacterium]MBT6077743.1 YjbE family putative metal transport protein [Oceanospirillaceae bacterium]
MFNWLDIGQIVFADLILSGDNALVIGMAAAGLAAHQRRKVILAGMALAALFRILFAVVASTIIGVPGILLLGGVLLAWVCWRFYGDIKDFAAPPADDTSPAKGKVTMGSALVTIAIADISMSLDNVLAVAAIARDNTQLLVIGLVLAIVLMAFFASLIMRVMLKFPAIAYVGLVFLVYLTTKMLYDGWLDLVTYF